MTYRCRYEKNPPNESSNYHHINPQSDEGKEARVYDGNGKRLRGYNCNLSLLEIVNIAVLEKCNWITRQKHTHMWYLKKSPKIKRI